MMRVICWIVGHKWSWREEGEMLRRWVEISVRADHECRRCGMSWTLYHNS